MRDSTTSNLARILSNIDLARFLSNIDSTKEMEQYMEIPKVADGFRSFPEYFQSLDKVKEMDRGELIRNSGLERSYFYQVMKGTRSPGRDKVLRLCLAAGLNLRQTTRALELSGNAALYARNRRDIILTVAVNQMADVDDTNLLLFRYGERPLN